MIELSITITCKFENPYEARQAAQRLHRKGCMVSFREQPRDIPTDPLLVAYPYGASGGNSAGNGLMGAMPPLAGNGVLLHTPEPQRPAILSVLTDDTQVQDARQLLQSMGGQIL